MSDNLATAERTGIQKAPTGIDGFDEITGGGLPKGRPSLVCGAAGCGKTLFAMEFLVRGATEFGEPGVFIAFEENENDLVQNVASLGFDLNDLEGKDLLRIDHIHIDRNEIDVAGDYDLEGLFIRLGFAIDSIGAKRIVLDTIETLFAGFENQGILRAELRRLFYWLKEKGVTAVITGERGEGQFTRQGLEEYVSDAVILLDHRITNQVSTRRMRVVKYRGSLHGTNEYPFLIGRDGITVMPLTSLGLQHGTSNERVPTGIPELDSMLGGEGYYRGSSILISGTAGTGKSSLAAHFAAASCARGEKCLYYSFEESPQQIVRNMRSIGVDLQPCIDSGSLRIVSTRPAHYGLEMHLATMLKEVRDFHPDAVLIDPVTTFLAAGTISDAESMLLRLVDYLKSQGITGVYNSLNGGGTMLESTEIGMSSLMDTWLLLRDIEIGGERNRGLYVLKSRGMPHSNQIREFIITDEGIRLKEVYLGPEGVLTGSARVAQEEREKAAEALAQEDLLRKRQLVERRMRALEAQIASIQSEIQSESLELAQAESRYDAALREALRVRSDMAASRRTEKGDA